MPNQKKIITWIYSGPGRNLGMACAEMRMDYRIVTRWKATDKRFRNAVKAAENISKQQAGDMAEGVLFLKAAEGNMGALKFYLVTQHAARGYVKSSEITLKDGRPSLTDKDKEEIERIKKAALRQHYESFGPGPGKSVN